MMKQQLLLLLLGSSLNTGSQFANAIHDPYGTTLNPSVPTYPGNPYYAQPIANPYNSWGAPSNIVTNQMMPSPYPLMAPNYGMATVTGPVVPHSVVPPTPVIASPMLTSPYAPLINNVAPAINTGPIIASPALVNSSVWPAIPGCAYGQIMNAFGQCQSCPAGFQSNSFYNTGCVSSYRPTTVYPSEPIPCKTNEYTTAMNTCNTCGKKWKPNAKKDGCVKA